MITRDDCKMTWRRFWFGVAGSLLALWIADLIVALLKSVGFIIILPLMSLMFILFSVPLSYFLRKAGPGSFLQTRLAKPNPGNAVLKYLLIREVFFTESNANGIRNAFLGLCKSRFGFAALWNVIFWTTVFAPLLGIHAWKLALFTVIVPGMPSLVVYVVWFQIAGLVTRLAPGAARAMRALRYVIPSLVVFSVLFAYFLGNGDDASDNSLGGAYGIQSYAFGIPTAAGLVFHGLLAAVYALGLGAAMAARDRQFEAGRFTGGHAMAQMFGSGLIMAAAAALQFHAQQNWLAQCPTLSPDERASRALVEAMHGAKSIRDSWGSGAFILKPTAQRVVPGGSVHEFDFSLDGVTERGWMRVSVGKCGSTVWDGGLE